MMKRLTTCAVALAAVAALSACDGNDSKSTVSTAPPTMPAPDPEPTGPQLTEVDDDLIENADVTETERTTADQRADIVNDDDEFVDSEGNAVVFDADVDGGVVAGNVVIENDDGEAETLTPSCTGSAAGLSGGTIRCTAMNSDGEIATNSGGENIVEPVDPTDIIDTETIGVLFEKNNIEINEGRGREDNPNYRIYGALMEYAGFSIQTGLILEDLPGQEVTVPLALGDATESRPNLPTASWEGVMVATTRTGDFAGNILQGDASLDFTGASNTLDIEFANIVDIDRGGATHSVTEVSFDDVPVAEAGTYAMSGDDGRYVNGAFYGRTHEEAAGVFEDSGLVGSFGAILDEPPSN